MLELLVAGPELPACFIVRPGRIETLCDLLLVDQLKPFIFSGRTLFVTRTDSC
jgi:hypothetical protein